MKNYLANPTILFILSASLKILVDFTFPYFLNIASNFCDEQKQRQLFLFF